MLKTYKIISLLLSYPNQEIYDFLPEVNFALKEEKLLNSDEIQGIDSFIAVFSAKPLSQWHHLEDSIVLHCCLLAVSMEFTDRFRSGDLVEAELSGTGASVGYIRIVKVPSFFYFRFGNQIYLSLSFVFQRKAPRRLVLGKGEGG